MHIYKQNLSTWHNYLPKEPGQVTKIYIYTHRIKRRWWSNDRSWQVITSMRMQFECSGDDSRTLRCQKEPGNEDGNTIQSPLSFDDNKQWEEITIAVRQQRAYKATQSPHEEWTPGCNGIVLKAWSRLSVSDQTCQTSGHLLMFTEAERSVSDLWPRVSASMALVIRYGGHHVDLRWNMSRCRWTWTSWQLASLL